MAAGLSEPVQGFLNHWQARQRRTAGLQAALFVQVDRVRRAHPEWRDYDLITVLLGALHLVIENDRLSGGRSREALLDDLTALCAWQQPDDAAQQHRDIAEATMDLLVNKRERQTRIQDRYVCPDASGNAQYAVQSFAFVTTVGEEDTSEPMLRATPEAINVFQNLVEFDPFDRLSAERYRSERMLQRRDYDEVLDSVDRRMLSVHGLSAQLQNLLRRIAYNVRDVSYAEDVMPRLDDILTLVGEQVEAEERFAESVAEHLHLHAPDLLRLQRLNGMLRDLIIALGHLQRTGAEVRTTFEAEQDRQVFTTRRLTINPQSQLFDPLLDLTPDDASDLLAPLMARLLGPRTPRVLSMQRLLETMAPTLARRRGDDGRDPFDLGELRAGHDDLHPAVRAAVHDVLDAVTVPTRLSQLLEGLEEQGALEHVDAEVAAKVPWALAVTVASAYGSTNASHAELSALPDAFVAGRLTVVRPDLCFERAGLGGDDLIVIPQPK